jgi:hypothetical protein
MKFRSKKKKMCAKFRSKKNVCLLSFTSRDISEPQKAMTQTVDVKTVDRKKVGELSRGDMGAIR